MEATSLVSETYLCQASEVLPNDSVLVEYDGEEFALFNTDDGYYAVTNRCPHEGAPLVGCPMHKGAAVCPLHGWRVPLRPRADGRPYDDGLRRLTVTERNGELHVLS